MKSAIKKLKNNKSLGADKISAEFYKYDSEEWGIGLICVLHKKDNQLDCVNYKGIPLLNVV